MPNFSKDMELCEVLPKIWNYMKFCEKYKVMCQFLPNLWSYAKFMKTGLPNPALCQRGLLSPGVRKSCSLNPGLCEPGLPTPGI